MGRLSVKGRMWPDPVIKADPFSNFPLSDKTVAHVFEVNTFIFEAAPQPLDEDIIQIAAPAIHGDFDACIPQNPRKGLTGELAALIRVEYFRPAVTFYGLLQSFDAKAGVQCI